MLYGADHFPLWLRGWVHSKCNIQTSLEKRKFMLLSSVCNFQPCHHCHFEQALDWVGKPDGFCNRSHPISLIIRRQLCSRCPQVGFCTGHEYSKSLQLFQELYPHTSSPQPLVTSPLILCFRSLVEQAYHQLLQVVILDPQSRSSLHLTQNRKPNMQPKILLTGSISFQDCLTDCHKWG